MLDRQLQFKLHQSYRPLPRCIREINVCVCVCERERERECVCVCVCATNTQLSLPHTHTHKHKLSLSLSYTHTHTLKLSLFLTHTHTHTHTFSSFIWIHKASNKNRIQILWEVSLQNDRYTWLTYIHKSLDERHSTLKDRQNISVSIFAYSQ